uniref:Uncharacterized protein n=1 Tax=viral metagenome TaxID=1070528 RepID=A0A6C0J7Q5_9ZZZZ
MGFTINWSIEQQTVANDNNWRLLIDKIKDILNDINKPWVTQQELHNYHKYLLTKGILTFESFDLWGYYDTRDDNDSLLSDHAIVIPMIESIVIQRIGPKIKGKLFFKTDRSLFSHIYRIFEAVNDIYGGVKITEN